MLRLNESQQRATMHKDGPMMVLAGPGSGKTAVIIRRVVHLIEKHNVPGNHILVITYSKAAAEEMKKRFNMLTENETVNFGTFHAIFFKMLRQSSNITLEQVFNEHERRGIIKSILSEMEYELEEENLSAVGNELSMVKNELLDLRYFHSASIGDADFVSLYEQYEQYKKMHSKIDFDDMLSLCYDMFINNPPMLTKWQQRFPYIMIDEFQDINRVQYEVVKLLASPKENLFIVGDDDQSIYRFRGSRPEFLLRFSDDYPTAKQEILEINYRSTDAVIQFANTLIAGNQVRYKKKITGTQKKGNNPVLLKADDSNIEAARIGEMIKSQWKKGADLDSIAVIYRVNMQSRAFSDVFLHMNIPFRVRDEMPSIYEHWITQDICAYLRLSQSHIAGYDPDAWRVINKPFRFISKAFLSAAKKSDTHIFHAYRQSPALHTGQRNKIEELIYDLQTIKKKKTTDAIRYIRTATGYDQHIISHCEYRKLNPEGLFEITDELLEAAKPFPKIQDYLSHIEESVQLAKTNKDTQEPSVTFTTMHSAKGLEFDTVYIAGVVDGIIPHERSKTDAELEEERRLLYVAVTRAQQNLYISIPAMRYEKKMKPSQFLSQK